MRGRNFINYRRVRINKPTKLDFMSRPCRYYQPTKTGTLSIITSVGLKMRLSHRAPLVKIARKFLKKKSLLTVSSSDNNVYTSKPLGVRMGKGKGKIDSTVLVARPGQPILTFSDVNILKVAKLFKQLRGRSPRLMLTRLAF